MKPTVLYELRVLNGEQRGASSAVRPGDLLRIGLMILFPSLVLFLPNLMR